MSVATIKGYFDCHKHCTTWCNGEIAPEHCDAFCVSYPTTGKNGLSTYKDIFFSSLAEAMLWCDLHLYAYDDNEDHICLIAANPWFFANQTYVLVSTPA